MSRLGPGSAGHFVKARDGIETMELTAETYDLTSKSGNKASTSCQY